MNKGVLMAVALDEFSLENVTEKGQQKTKATIRVSFPGGYTSGQNGQQGKREYCRLRCTTSSPYMIEKLMALGIPQGRVPQGQQFYLTIPYKNMYWTLWNGNNGPGVTGYAEIDGDVLWTQPAPKPQNQNSGFQNGGGHQNGGFQPVQPQFQSAQPQGGFPGQAQPQFQQPHGGFPNQPVQPQFQQPQPGFQPQGGYPNQGAPNFPAANPPGFGQPQPGFQQPQPGFQSQPQGNFPGQPAPMGGPAQPAAPFPTGQPFPQPQNGFQTVAGSDPYTA